MDIIQGYFSTALEHIFKFKDVTQAEVAKRVGISPSSINDYIKGRRGTNTPEDIRRKISYALDWNYEELLSLGQLISEGHSPHEWELAVSSPEKARTYRVWRKTDGTDILAIPAPCIGLDVRTDIKPIPAEDWAPEQDFVFISCYITHPESTFDPETTLTLGKMAFRKDWLGKISRGRSQQCFVIHAVDESMRPIIRETDSVLVCPEADEALREGHVYCIRSTITGRLVTRRLAPRPEGVIIYADSSIIPPYTLPKEQMEILGRVLWVGHELC